ncbi:MAG: TonB-dependent receptor, partial [Terriglobales bacterium]
QLNESQRWQSVLRGGFGVFYDLATSELGNLLANGYPSHASTIGIGGSFPLSATISAPPAIIPPDKTQGTLTGFDPNLKLPYTLQWNVAFEQAIGRQQSLSASYLGSVGRRLLQSAFIYSPNPNYGSAYLVANTATSDYHALQIQFQRQLSHGLQALAAYTWSHSIDTASAGSVGNSANELSVISDLNANRGPSDFDLRHAASLGLTYRLPGPKSKRVFRAVLGGWSLQSVLQARSAPPVNVYDSAQYRLANGFGIATRPDLVPGIPLYLYGSQYPGGRIINNTPNQGGAGCLGPFCPAPPGFPVGQGSLGRNALRGFGAVQWDLAFHKDFDLHENLRLEFRSEMFNVLNHPNFGPPNADLASPLFGSATQTLAEYLSAGAPGSGGLNPLYQIGGPRSIQFALKLRF